MVRADSTGVSSQRPCSGPPSRAAKVAGESKLGRHRQSTDPALLITALPRRSLTKPSSSIGIRLAAVSAASSVRDCCAWSDLSTRVTGRAVVRRSRRVAAASNQGARPVVDPRARPKAPAGPTSQPYEAIWVVHTSKGATFTTGATAVAPGEATGEYRIVSTPSRGRYRTRCFVLRTTR